MVLVFKSLVKHNKVYYNPWDVLAKDHVDFETLKKFCVDKSVYEKKVGSNGRLKDKKEDIVEDDVVVEDPSIPDVGDEEEDEDVDGWPDAEFGDDDDGEDGEDEDEESEGSDYDDWTRDQLMDEAEKRWLKRGVDFNGNTSKANLIGLLTP